MGVYHSVLVDMMFTSFDINAAIAELKEAQERLEDRVVSLDDGGHALEVLRVDKMMIGELVDDLIAERAKIEKGDYRDKKHTDGIPDIHCAHCKSMLFVADYTNDADASASAWQAWVCHAWSSRCIEGKIMLAQKLLEKHGIMQWLLSSDDHNVRGFGDDITNDLGCLTHIIYVLKKHGHSFGWTLMGILDYMALRAEASPSDDYAVFDPELLKYPLEQFEQAEERGNLFGAFWRLKVLWEFNRPDFEKANGNVQLAALNRAGVYEAGDFLDSITPDIPGSEKVKVPWWKRVITSLLGRTKEGEVA